MKKIVALSAFMISLSIMVVAGVLFSFFIDENIGGFTIIFLLLGLIIIGILMVEEVSPSNKRIDKNE